MCTSSVTLCYAVFISGLLSVERTTSLLHSDPHCPPLCSAGSCDRRYSVWCLFNDTLSSLYLTRFISLLRLAALLKCASLFAALTCAHLTALSTSRRSFELWTFRFPNLCIGSAVRSKLTVWSRIIL